MCGYVRHTISPGVAGIGEYCLIAGEAGVENDFAATTSASTRRAAAKDTSVFEREYRATCWNFGQGVVLPENVILKLHALTVEGEVSDPK